MGELVPYLGIVVGALIGGGLGLGLAITVFLLYERYDDRRIKERDDDRRIKEREEREERREGHLRHYRCGRCGLERSAWSYEPTPYREDGHYWEFTNYPTEGQTDG